MSTADPRITANTLLKVLGADGRPYHGGMGRAWPLPTPEGPGRWRSVRGRLVPCRHGLHLCRPAHLLDWLGPTLYVAEAQGDLLDAGDKLVARRARLLAPVPGYNNRTLRLFAADCAARALARTNVTDPRSHAAVAIARRYARGEASDAERGAAWAAAEAAADAAAGDAADAAARAAAGDAADAAARAAAWAAAEDAAWAAAGAAAWAAAEDAAWAAERAWQATRLVAYLNGEAGA